MAAPYVVDPAKCMFFTAEGQPSTDPVPMYRPASETTFQLWPPALAAGKLQMDAETAARVLDIGKVITAYNSMGCAIDIVAAIFQPLLKLSVCLFLFFLFLFSFFLFLFFLFHFFHFFSLLPLFPLFPTLFPPIH